MAVAHKGLRLFSHDPLWFSSPFPSPHPIPYSLLGPLQRMGSQFGGGGGTFQQASSGNAIGPWGSRRGWRTIKMLGTYPSPRLRHCTPGSHPLAGGQTCSQPAGRVQNFWPGAMIWVKAGSWSGAAGDPGSAVCTHAPAVLQSVG